MNRRKRRKKPRSEAAITWKRVYSALLDAAETIEHNGWIQNDVHNRNGYDIFGALHMAVKTDMRLLVVAMSQMTWYLNPPSDGFLVLRKNATNIFKWNDAPERTKEEVVMALVLAAKDLAIQNDGYALVAQ